MILHKPLVLVFAKCSLSLVQYRIFNAFIYHATPSPYDKQAISMRVLKELLLSYNPSHIRRNNNDGYFKDQIKDLNPTYKAWHFAPDRFKVLDGVAIFELVRVIHNVVHYEFSEPFKKAFSEECLPVSLGDTMPMRSKYAAPLYELLLTHEVGEDGDAIAFKVKDLGEFLDSPYEGFVEVKKRILMPSSQDVALYTNFYLGFRGYKGKDVVDLYLYPKDQVIGIVDIINRQFEGAHFVIKSIAYRYAHAYFDNNKHSFCVLLQGDGCNLIVHKPCDALLKRYLQKHLV